jgi:hypothetical protein
MSTPTPRTDGNTMHPVTNTGIIKTTAGVLDADGAFVFAVLARQLERELAAEKARADENYARAASMVWHLPPETLAGNVQKWRDEYASDRDTLKSRAEKAEAEALSERNQREHIAATWKADDEMFRRVLPALRSQLARKDEALRSLTPLLRHRPDGDIAWRGNPSARCGYIKVSDILLIEKAQEALT